MSFPRGTLTCFIIYLILTTELANGFAKFDSNHLVLKLHANKIALTQTVEKWIEQPLDHFDSNEKRTLKMRYHERLDLWQPHGPIIICIGGESRETEVTDSVSIDVDGLPLSTQLAKETHGALVSTEHRYYGSSKPDISRNNMTEYYKFLSSQQALADIAHLIKFLKSDPKYKTSKVVAIGGSYAGNLAAWVRELYPDLVDAAVAASAPVMAKKDFKEYLDGVRYTFGKYGGEKCLKDMEKRYRRYEELLKTSHGIETLKRKLSICPSNDLTVFENQQMLFSHIYDEESEVAQFMTPSDVKNVCQSMESKHRFMGDGQAGTCIDVALNLQNFTGPWTYQFCSEFGYLQTTSSEIQPFVHWGPLEFNLKYCKDLIIGDIEKRINEGVSRTNQMYGGKRPNVTKVVFTNGDMDPWHALGVLEDLGPEAPAFLINGTSHCAVLDVRDDEPQELSENRKYIKKLIKKWISTP